MTVRKDEALVIRGLAARFLAGESLRSLAIWLDAEQVRTVAGGPWRTSTLRAMLSSGRIAGLREHRGQVIGKARWRRIISEAQRSRILARMAEQTVSGRRPPRRYLLSGMLRCGKCRQHALQPRPRDDAPVCLLVRPRPWGLRKADRGRGATRGAGRRDGADTPRHPSPRGCTCRSNARRRAGCGSQ